ncbi:MAG: class III extradiol dioxygenase subunit B-like domain-containing protein [Actinomycetota bacterium]
MGDGMVGGCVVPHPPLLIPEIGGRDQEAVRSTCAAMKELSRRIAELEPDVLVAISPHTPPYRDTFIIKDAPVLGGSFASFGRPQVRIAKDNDLELVAAMIKSASSEGVPLISRQQTATRWSEAGEELDHGLLVPLYFLDQAFDTPMVCLSISGLSYHDHFLLGRVASRACADLRRRAVFVASGDLSHRLIKGAPAGYDPSAQDFDRRIVDIAARGDFDAIVDIPEDLVELAGECGFRSIHAMWGALKNGTLTNSVLSYEGPFGVGYLVSLHLKNV